MSDDTSSGQRGSHQSRLEVQERNCAPPRFEGSHHYCTFLPLCTVVMAGGEGWIAIAKFWGNQIITEPDGKCSSHVVEVVQGKDPPASGVRTVVTMSCSA